MSIEPQSILITGGRGMLARAMVESLERRERRAVTLGSDALDITRRDALRDAFDRYRPAIVFNCAAHTKVDLCEREEDRANAINGHAVGELARLCREFDAYLVHVSTDFVFDGRSRRPYQIDDATAPLNAYGRSKLLGEQLLQQNAPAKWLIVRTAWLYGNAGANFAKTIVDRARSGGSLRVVNDQIGSPTYASDLADAMLDLVDREVSGIVHVTNSGEATWYDFARAILEEFDLLAHADFSPTTSAEWARIRPGIATRPAYSVLDGARFASIIGRPMRPWREALHAYRESLRWAESRAPVS